MRCAAACVVVLALAAPRPAAADDNDLVMSRLGTVVRNADGTIADVVGDNPAYRALASELGVVLAPRMTDGADTLGWGGFQFTADLAFTGITSGASYWRVLESSPEPSGSGVSNGSDVMTTAGIFAKKGIILPLPSFEIGIGAVHLLRSRIWAAQTYAKFALHEGYHDLPLPSLAVRAGVSRMMGSTDINLTIASIDAVLSKDFGIAGTFRLTPYIGWNWLVIVARSEVIDRTPNVDDRMNPADLDAQFVFTDEDNILRSRLFGGVRWKYHVLTVGLEAALALAGDSLDDRAGTDADCAASLSPTSNCDTRDTARRQATTTVTVGVDF